MKKIKRKEGSSERRTGVPMEYFELTDVHWSRIKKVEKNISNDARIRIGLALGAYQTKHAWTRTSLKTKRLVISAQNTTKKLGLLLNELADDTVYFKVHLVSGENIDSEIAAIREAQEKVSYVTSVLKRGGERMAVKRGRKSAKPLEELIVSLMQVCAQEAGRRVSRSSKQGALKQYDPFIYACINLLSPKIPESRTDAVLRRVIGRYHAARAQNFDMSLNKRLSEN